ncbi:S8 family peptidase [Hydrogenophaga sp.]|uniref:S8 family peptidase n=1 Tax=Hydrogenophaga sp. TaxID=1904254 RepID=UPI002608926A|nr:S8 family peptidase [Hydrogenophaga sp.]MDM7948742.1 S8 family peptidase [Hydrogenophaga sp.]
MSSTPLQPSRRPRCLLMAALLGVCLSAVAAPKTGKLPSSAVAVTPVAEPASVQRLLIRYRTGIKMGAAASADGATERAQAAAQVMRSAGLAGESRMHYLKSVSPSMHVATLEQAVSAAEARAMMQRLQADPAVLDVMIDQRAKPHFVPNDPYFTGRDQWHLQPSSVIPGGLNVNDAWDRSTGSGVVIAILDGGYVTHADLLPNVLPGYDFVSADPPGSTPTLAGQPFWTANDGNDRDSFALDPGDWVTQAEVTAGFCDEATPESTWHGSHVAGLAGAAGNNSQSGLGVAFGARILPVRVLGRCGGYVSDILAGARWAVGLDVLGVPRNPTPARILNLSLGLPGTCSSTIQSVIDEVRSQDVSIVASAGNDGNTLISVPANCRGVFAVTAHTREGDSADYANVGSGVRISAAGGGLNTLLLEQPGSPRGIVSTGNAGLTVPTSDADLLLSGTSMAAPQVAGVLALLAAVRPDLSMSTLESFVVGSARAFPAGGYCATNPQALPSGFCGSGLLDADAAMATALGIAPSGGGGCTAAPNGQADLSLLLLALAAAGLMVWRRRQVR